MKTKLTTCFLILTCCLSANNTIFAQNSVLVNFGSPTCSDPLSPGFSLIKDPFGAAPSLLSSCDMKAQLPTFFGEFIAYNPKDNKIYVADINNFTQSRIWVLDIGLPSGIGCPVIPVDPDYSYDYVSNNFEFDNNGDLWSFSNYDPGTGLCNIDKFDVNTGNIINTRTIKFPKGNFPNTITSGDLTILPNGRMFTTLGRDSSKLYEITNYNSGDTATATYLKTLPLNCFGIAYINGQLEITGTDIVSSCYYFSYNISTNTLSDVIPFQAGQSPIDNTSFSPALGTAKRILNVSNAKNDRADITYEIYVKNMGNVILNNINVTDNLVAAFGAGNVSNVSASFVAGSNAAGLTLNPAYNGATVTSLLSANQNLPNQTLDNTDYFFKIQIKCHVSHIKCNVDYLNSAIASAAINSAVDLINVSDSSNNGTEASVDPNNDGNAGGAGENIPTPFKLQQEPPSHPHHNDHHPHCSNVHSNHSGNHCARVSCRIESPENASSCSAEYSTDGNNWHRLATINTTGSGQADYEFTHENIPSGDLYYRIELVSKSGTFEYSKVVTLNDKNSRKAFVVFPNPANDIITVNASYEVTGKTSLELYDAFGKKVLTGNMSESFTELNTSRLPSGHYLLKIINKNTTESRKILIMH